ncbi:hypothetical protein I3842_10G118900 [Carya illinoinensis]|uniref:Phytocyanin domain-containing protein n=1 Tax=Carya illinoinensis TaxID=32201 RepID=A0A922J3W4_CARIL|nr:hypothetical protein I3842_10G118900 [Carya illinoinensis]
MDQKFTSIVVMFFDVVATVFLQWVEAQTVHVVGHSIGWTILMGGASSYQTWVASKQFVVSDILFQLHYKCHDVLQVPKEAYDNCSSSNAIGDTINTGPINLTLSIASTHYYICTLGRHCLLGQKLSVTISSSPSAIPPTGTSTPPSTPATVDQKFTSVVVIFFVIVAAVFLQCAKAQTIHVVGGSIGSTVPTGGAFAYQTWVASKQFLRQSNHLKYTHYHICTLGQHYLSRQKFSITVSSSPGAIPPTSTSTPPSTPTTNSTPSPRSETPANCGPTPTSSPTPTPGTMSPLDSASSGVFASLSIFLLSIVMGFLF